MKQVLVILFFVAVVLVIGCDGASLIRAPLILSVAMDTASVTVTWAYDPAIAEHEDFQGYNVYVYTDSTALLVVNGENLNRHNATVITDTFYTARNLSKDTVYYFQARTLNIEDQVGTFNPDTRFVTASPRPEFTVTLKFEIDPQNLDEVDIALRFADAALLGEIGGQIDSTADVFFYAYEDTMPQVASPDFRIDPIQINPKQTRMENIGQMGLDDVTEAPEIIDKQNVHFIEGDVIVLKTEEGNYVKMHIDEMFMAPEWIVTVTYAYQNIVDYPYF
ncbi:MAG: fibronectin type III domain-containing protein [candidate division WOR-3 bacterium]|nr:MAG: fibronectin type III domain-containing protein [candidate division WOR-3 bacterium]